MIWDEAAAVKLTVAATARGCHSPLPHCPRQPCQPCQQLSAVQPLLFSAAPPAQASPALPPVLRLCLKHPPQLRRGSRFAQALHSWTGPPESPHAEGTIPALCSHQPVPSPPLQVQEQAPRRCQQGTSQVPKCALTAATRAAKSTQWLHHGRWCPKNGALGSWDG